MYIFGVGKLDKFIFRLARVKPQMKLGLVLLIIAVSGENRVLDCYGVATNFWIQAEGIYSNVNGLEELQTAFYNLATSLMTDTINVNILTLGINTTGAVNFSLVAAALSPPDLGRNHGWGMPVLYIDGLYQVTVWGASLPPSAAVILANWVITCTRSSVTQPWKIQKIIAAFPDRISLRTAWSPLNIPNTNYL